MGGLAFVRRGRSGSGGRRGGRAESGGRHSTPGRAGPSSMLSRWPPPARLARRADCMALAPADTSSGGGVQLGLVGLLDAEPRASPAAPRIGHCCLRPGGLGGRRPARHSRSRAASHPRQGSTCGLGGPDRCRSPHDRPATRRPPVVVAKRRHHRLVERDPAHALVGCCFCSWPHRGLWSDFAPFRRGGRQRSQFTRGRPVRTDSSVPPQPLHPEAGRPSAITAASSLRHVARP